MKILVVGCGRLGSKTISQLKKNPSLQIVTADSRENPLAVQNGLISKVDIIENITSLNIRRIAQEHDPDVVLLARTADDWGHQDTVMAAQLVARMEEELNILHIPILPISDRIDF